MNLYITRNGQQQGPYSIEEARRLRADGKIQSSDLAWYEGLTNWIPLGQVPGIAFATSPIGNPLPAPPVTAPPDSTLLLRRLATAFVLFVVLFFILFVVIFIVAVMVGGAISGAQASVAGHAHGYDEGYKIGQEAGRKFGQTYSGLIAGLDAVGTLFIAAITSLALSFSKLFPWCRPKKS